MGTFVGLLFGIGVLLIWQALSPSRPERRRRTALAERTQEALTQAGIESVSPGQLVGLSAGLCCVAFLGGVVVSGSPTIALAFAVFAAMAPFSLVRYRQRRRTVELRELWPEVVDNVGSAVRAGMSLPEALAEVGVRGPETLRRPFQRFAADYRANGRFDDCVNRLKVALADPVGDRMIESLRVARDVGGTDLGRLLRTLSTFLREDARTRAELETRQGWTVNAARLALAAPWLMLALLALNGEAAAAYNTAAGAFILLLGGGVSFAAYRIMLRIGRLPQERRVLR
ncbi:MAG: tight adherence protein [Frankiales bacterium]|jgi:tight adherence protein B|nr:tight adherence protein [Frankiales bacterium]